MQTEKDLFGPFWRTPLGYGRKSLLSAKKKTRNGPRPRRSRTNAALYAPPLMRAMSASCSALTRSSDSYSTRRRSSSRRRSRAAADFTAESRLRRSDSAAAWLRLPTARSFSRSVAAAFRVAFFGVRFRTHGHGARVSERNRRGRYATRVSSERAEHAAPSRGDGGDDAPERSPVPPTSDAKKTKRHTNTEFRSSPRRPPKTRDVPVGPPRPPRWRPYR